MGSICFWTPTGNATGWKWFPTGEWLSLGCSFEGNENYYSYNPDFADTIHRVEEMDFSDGEVYTSMDSGGQSPIPKIQAITDMQAGVKAVEYFIRTGKLYPGIDWAYSFF